MPSPSSFKRGFGLVPHTIIPLQDANHIWQLQVQECRMQHLVKTPYELYVFPFSCKMKCSRGSTGSESRPNVTDLTVALHHFRTPAIRIVLSAFGSPYRCHLGKWKLKYDADHDIVTVSGIGRAERDRTGSAAGTGRLSGTVEDLQL